MERASLWRVLLVLTVAACGATCTQKSEETPSPAVQPLPEPTPKAAAVPSYEELIGPKLAQKMKNSGPWSFDDLEPLHQAALKLKKLNEDLANSTDPNLKAAAKQRYSELVSTYVTLKQVADTQKRMAPVIVPTPGGAPATTDPQPK